MSNGHGTTTATLTQHKLPNDYGYAPIPDTNHPTQTVGHKPFFFGAPRPRADMGKPRPPIKGDGANGRKPTALNY